jgi:hypothetical protein
VARYTKNKRPEKKLGVEHDIQQAEHIQSGLETFFEKLVQFKWLALGGLAGVLVLVAAITIIGQRLHAGDATVGADVDAAMAAVKAIDTASDDDARKAAADKALTVLEPLAAKYAGNPTGQTMAWLKATVLAKADRAADAAPLLEQVKADPGADALDLPVLLLAVETLKAKGDLEGGVKAIESASVANDLLSKLVLAKLLGDLYNPFLGDAKNPVKDREKALHHYNEAMTLLKDRPTGKPGSTESFFQNEIQKRIAFLKG